MILSLWNVSIIIVSFKGFKIVELWLDDIKNLDDIDIYLFFKVFFWKDFFVYKIKMNFVIINNEVLV